jgi:tetratricopeptide (TPR) repeat protein
LFLGKRLIETGEIDGAVDALQMAIAPEAAIDTQVDAHLLLGELIYDNDVNEVEAHFAEAVAISSSDIQVFFQIVTFYLDKRDVERGRMWAAQMQNVYPGASLTHDMLGWLYWLAGDEALALAHYETAVATNDDLQKPWTYGRLGNIYMSLGQYDDAISSFQTALSLIDNTSLPLATNLAKAYLAKGDCQNADLLIKQLAQQVGIENLSSVEPLRQQITNACEMIGSE